MADIKQQLEMLAVENSDNAMMVVADILDAYPSHIPQGFDILGANGGDNAVAFLFLLSGRYPEYIPQGLKALGETGNVSSSLEIFNLTVSYPTFENVMHAFDALAGQGRDRDAVMIGALLGCYPDDDFMKKGLGSLAQMGTEKALRTIVNVMKAFPEYEDLGLKTLEACDGALAKGVYEDALKYIEKRDSLPPAAIPPTMKEARAANVRRREGFDYGKTPDKRLDVLAEDGSERAVKEMYRIVTNYPEYLDKGIALLGENSSDFSVVTLQKIVEAHPDFVSQGIDALGKNTNENAPIAIDELVRAHPTPEHIGLALGLLGRNSGRNAIITIGEIMKERPEHLKDGYEALEGAVVGDHKDLAIQTIIDVMDEQERAVPQGLVVLSEDGGDVAMAAFDRILEGVTGVDLTTPKKISDDYTLAATFASIQDDPDYKDFVLELEEILLQRGISLSLDDSFGDAPTDGLNV